MLHEIKNAFLNYYLRFVFGIIWISDKQVAKPKIATYTQLFQDTVFNLVEEILVFQVLLFCL